MDGFRKVTGAETQGGAVKKGAQSSAEVAWGGGLAGLGAGDPAGKTPGWCGPSRS